MASIGEDFEEWLCTKLKALNTDQDVFATYIRSILEGDDTNEEKLEALEGILIEITVKKREKADGSTITISQEIMDKWEAFLKAQNNNNAVLQLDVDAQLATIMEKQAQSVVVAERKRTDDVNSDRAAILAQYSQVSDHEDDDSDDVESKEAGSSVAVCSNSLLPKNTNADDVTKAEKERRDKAKVDNEKKKALDKANKEKQRQQQQERKEKEKKRTQKGERKR